MIPPFEYMLLCVFAKLFIALSLSTPHILTALSDIINSPLDAQIGTLSIPPGPPTHPPRAMPVLPLSVNEL